MKLKVSKKFSKKCNGKVIEISWSIPLHIDIKTMLEKIRKKILLYWSDANILKMIPCREKDLHVIIVVFENRLCRILPPENIFKIDFNENVIDLMINIPETKTKRASKIKCIIEEIWPEEAQKDNFKNFPKPASIKREKLILDKSFKKENIPIQLGKRVAPKDIADLDDAVSSTHKKVLVEVNGKIFEASSYLFDSITTSTLFSRLWIGKNKLVEIAPPLQNPYM